MLFRMVPKQQTLVQHNDYSFRVMLFGMVPKQTFDLAFLPCFIAMLLKQTITLKQSVIFITRLEFLSSKTSCFNFRKLIK